jgi:hypothetical protein
MLPRVPTADELEAQAAETADNEMAARLHREAEALRRRDLFEALEIVERAVRETRGPYFPRLVDRVGAIFGAALHRLKGETRLAALEAFRRARGGGAAR